MARRHRAPAAACDTLCVFAPSLLAALVGYEILVVLFAVVMLLALVGVSVVGILQRRYRRAALRRARRRTRR